MARQNPNEDDVHEDALLEAYKNEPAVTWDELNTRTPICPSDGDGAWRYASAEQIIRGMRY